MKLDGPLYKVESDGGSYSIPKNSRDPIRLDKQNKERAANELSSLSENIQLLDASIKLQPEAISRAAVHMNHALNGKTVLVYLKERQQPSGIEQSSDLEQEVERLKKKIKQRQAELEVFAALVKNIQRVLPFFWEQLVSVTSPVQLSEVPEIPQVELPEYEDSSDNLSEGERVLFKTIDSLDRELYKKEQHLQAIKGQLANAGPITDLPEILLDLFKMIEEPFLDKTNVELMQKREEALPRLVQTPRGRKNLLKIIKKLTTKKTTDLDKLFDQASEPEVRLQQRPTQRFQQQGPQITPQLEQFEEHIDRLQSAITEAINLKKKGFNVLRRRSMVLSIPQFVFRDVRDKCTFILSSVFNITLQDIRELRPANEETVASQNELKEHVQRVRLHAQLDTEKLAEHPITEISNYLTKFELYDLRRGIHELLIAVNRENNEVLRTEESKRRIPTTRLTRGGQRVTQREQTVMSEVHTNATLRLEGITRLLKRYPNPDIVQSSENSVRMDHWNKLEDQRNFFKDIEKELTDAGTVGSQQGVYSKVVFHPESATKKYLENLTDINGTIMKGLLRTIAELTGQQETASWVNNTLGQLKNGNCFQIEVSYSAAEKELFNLSYGSAPELSDPHLQAPSQFLINTSLAFMCGSGVTSHTDIRPPKKHSLVMSIKKLLALIKMELSPQTSEQSVPRTDISVSFKPLAT